MSGVDELARFMSTVKPAQGETIERAYPRMAICGDCGVWPAENPDVCPKCGGQARPQPTIAEIKEIATQRLTELFTVRDEVRVPVTVQLWVCPPCGRTRHYRPSEPCGRCRADEWTRKELLDSAYLDDAFGDFAAWPAPQQAAYLVNVAFGLDPVRVCRLCKEAKHQGPCGDPR